MVIGAIAILFTIFYEFPTSSKKRVRIPRAGSDVSTGEKGILERIPFDIPKAIDRQMPSEKAWGRDPFELPPGVGFKGAEEEGESLEPVKLAEPKIKEVTAILITGSRKVASINHEVVEVGDLVDGERVLQIEHDRVILQKGGQKRVIMLDDSPFSMEKK